MTRKPNKQSETCSPPQMLAALHAGNTWLEANVEFINALNVFPVPDGDTGTNMLLTFRSSLQSTDTLPKTDFEILTKTMSKAALLGARGNSGVILSQIIDGFAKGLSEKKTIDGESLTFAFQEASKAASNAMVDPVEGTMLTVIRDAATGAKEFIRTTPDSSPSGVLQAALTAARKSLENTPNLLPVLKQAGVVDSGGQGLVILLEGICNHIDGKPLPIPYIHSGNIDTDWIKSQNTSEDYGFCTEFVIQDMNTPFEEVQSVLRKLGDSEGLIGDISLARVHIHTDDPDAILKYGEGVGQLEQVSIRDMEQQHDQFLSFHDNTDLAIASGVVTVASGAGFANIMRSLGSSAVVWGGQTMNPSVEDLLTAIESVPSNDIILLPNNKNIIQTAKQTHSVTGKNIHVIATTSMVEGIAALIAFLQDVPAAQNVVDMTQASSIEWGEITHAVRTVQMNGVTVNAGSPIGISDDTIISTGNTSEESLLNLCKKLQVKTDTILSVYYGSEVEDSTVEETTMMLRSAFPETEIELLYGGQPHYAYIVAVDNENDS